MAGKWMIHGDLRVLTGLHIGDITELIVPRTTVGKNIMQKPITKGRSSGNTSIGSARANACHIR